MPDCGNLQLMIRLVERYGFDQSDPLTEVINMAMHEVEAADDWPFLEEVVLVNANPGTATLVLPTDFVKVITLRDTTHASKLKYWSRHQFALNIQDQTDPGQPEVYTLISTNSLSV